MANYTKEFLRDIDIDFFDRPARDPDLNPIENLWSIFVRSVYVYFCHFEDVNSLKEAILYAWENIEIEELRKLVISMKQRCIDVLGKRSGPIKY